MSDRVTMFCVFCGEDTEHEVSQESEGYVIVRCLECDNYDVTTKEYLQECLSTQGDAFPPEI